MLQRWQSSVPQKVRNSSTTVSQKEERRIENKLKKQNIQSLGKKQFQTHIAPGVNAH